MSIPLADECKHWHDQIQPLVVKAHSPWEVWHCALESNSASQWNSSFIKLSLQHRGKQILSTHSLLNQDHMATDIHTFISAFFCLATEILTQLHRKLNSHIPHIPKHKKAQDEEVNLTLPRGPHQVNGWQTLNPSFISSDSYWCQQSMEEPDLRACFDTVQQWIINSSRSHKASARSKHEPSMMINQNAIINAPASHKMSPNSPSHKIQKAPHRNAHPHIWKQKQFCAFTFVSSGLYYQLWVVWEKKALPCQLQYQ